LITTIKQDEDDKNQNLSEFINQIYFTLMKIELKAIIKVLIYIL